MSVPTEAASICWSSPPTPANKIANPLILLRNLEQAASRTRHRKNRPHTPARPVAGKGARPCGLSRRERDERGGVVHAPAGVGCGRPSGLKPRALAGRALCPFNKEHGQGTHAVPGIGFARLRPARRRPCRQGAKSVAGPGWGRPLHLRPTATGQTSRAERLSVAETHISYGLRATARRSAGPSQLQPAAGFRRWR